MATSVITNAKIEIVDNMAIVTLPEAIEDNYQYDIRIKNLKSADGFSSLDNFNYKVITQMSPAYCKVSDVAVLVDTYGIPESTVYYYIRSASQYVDYILQASSTLGGTVSTEVTFPMMQFVRIKTMIDCLLSAYARKAVGTSVKGKLGEISFGEDDKYSSSIDDLLDDLWRQLKYWEDALKGYELEGRAKPKFAIKASKTSDSTAYDEIVDSIDRTLPDV